jgi:hypothetical protein
MANMEMPVILVALLLRYDITLKSQELTMHEGFLHQPLSMAVLLLPRQHH